MTGGHSAANALIPFMTRVGVGPNGSKSLSYEDAYEAMTAILEGQYHPTTLGGFLQSLRFKGETEEELAGFVDAVRDHDVAASPPAPQGVLDVAGNYDGKRTTPHISVAASLVAAGAGLPVLMHDGVRVPTKQGVTKVHALRALGVGTDAAPRQVVEALQEIGVGFFQQRVVTPGLYGLLSERIALGKRSFINVVETLINPVGATAHVGSFFHVAYGERVCRALMHSRVGFKRVVMVQGLEGVDEIRLERARVTELKRNEISIYWVRSGELGLPGTNEDLERIGADPLRSAELTEALLRGEPTADAFRSAVLLNAAVRLYTGGRAESIERGLTLALNSIDDGAAWERLVRWRERDTRSTTPACAQTGVERDRKNSYQNRVGWKGPMTTYPIFLVGLSGRRCVVVGGGAIATEKVHGLLGGGASCVDVISPEISPELRGLAEEGRVRHLADAFSPEYLDGAFVVISATDDPHINRRVFSEGEARGILVQVVDDPPRCTFIMPSIVRRGDLTVAISTGGASPALASRLRQRLADELGDEYEHFVRLAGRIRPTIMDRISDPRVRKALWYEIVDSEILSLFRDGCHDDAVAEAERLIDAAAAEGRQVVGS